MNTTTLATEFARQGRDWEEELRQREREVALMKELGLTPAQAQPRADSPDDTDKEEDDGQEQDANAISRIAA